MLKLGAVLVKNSNFFVLNDTYYSCKYCIKIIENYRRPAYKSQKLGVLTNENQA